MINLSAEDDIFVINDVSNIGVLQAPNMRLNLVILQL